MLPPSAGSSPTSPCRRALATAAVVAILLGAATTSHALPGDQDPTFGVGGRLRVGLFDGRAAVRFANDTIVLAVGPELWRYTADGVLDPSFGTGGKRTVGFKNALLALPDGKIIAADDDAPADFDIRLTRYDVDGSIDTTFGTGGFAYVDTPQSLSVLARQPDGAILVGDTDWLARFTPEGIPDASFSGGYAEYDVPSSPSGPRTLVVQSTGYIVVASPGMILRVEPDGTPDETFGPGGFLPGELASGLLLQPDDKMVLNRAGDLVRLLPDGARDLSFGVDGVVAGAGGDMLLQPDGRIVVEDDQLVTRYLADGSIDPTFPAASAVRNIRPQTPTLTLLRQSDARIVLVGLPDVVTIVANTCGDGTPEAGEDCDDGNLDDGDGCDAHCCLADGDGDGRCDAIDPCTGGTTLEKATIKVSGSQTRKLLVTGTIRTTPPLMPALDPSIRGFRFRVEGPAHVVADYTVPPGLYDPATRIGWIRKGSPERPRWTWKGTQTTNAFSLEQVDLKDKSNATTGRIEAKIRAKKEIGAFGGDDNFGAYTGPGAVPPILTLVADAPTADGGQCGSTSFSGPAPAPSCTTKPFSQISCR